MNITAKFKKTPQEIVVSFYLFMGNILYNGIVMIFNMTMEGIIMWQALMLVHILGAVFMGFYGIAPFLAGRLKASSPAVQEGVISNMSFANRIGQVMLIVQFLTGGYMLSQGNEYSVLWMVLSIVVFLAIGAFSGMMGSALKKSLLSAKGDKSHAGALDKVKTFSTMAFVSYMVIIVLMVYNNI